MRIASQQSSGRLLEFVAPPDDDHVRQILALNHVALGAARLLVQEDGLSAEVVDPRTMTPLDRQTLIESARKTTRAVVLDEGYSQCGVTAELASVVADAARALCGRS